MSGRFEWILSLERERGFECGSGRNLGSRKRNFNESSIVINIIYLLYKSKYCMTIS